eukprot:678604-Alexandrium_andersonii.AAC.1
MIHHCLNVRARFVRWVSVPGGHAPVAYTLECNKYLCQDADAIEWFAGCKSWTAGLRARGLTVYTYELLDGPSCPALCSWRALELCSYLRVANSSFLSSHHGFVAIAIGGARVVMNICCFPCSDRCRPL